MLAERMHEMVLSLLHPTVVNRGEQTDKSRSEPGSQQ